MECLCHGLASLLGVFGLDTLMPRNGHQVALSFELSTMQFLMNHAARLRRTGFTWTDAALWNFLS